MCGGAAGNLDAVMDWWMATRFECPYLLKRRGVVKGELAVAPARSPLRSGGDPLIVFLRERSLGG